MQAMILAAGRGQRMRHLTDHMPKPLLSVAGQALIDYHLFALREAGFDRVIVNHAYLGEQIEHHIGDGSRYGLEVVFSPERSGGLETGGGIFRALPLLFARDRDGDDRVLIVNADVYTDYRFPMLADALSATEDLAHLVLVDNPPFHEKGDFLLQSDGRVSNLQYKKGKCALTYSGLSVLRKSLFDDCSDDAFPLAPLLRSAADRGLVSGEHHLGQWSDVGTPERLDALEKRLR